MQCNESHNSGAIQVIFPKTVLASADAAPRVFWPPWFGYRIGRKAADGLGSNGRTD